MSGEDEESHYSSEEYDPDDDHNYDDSDHSYHEDDEFDFFPRDHYYDETFEDDDSDEDDESSEESEDDELEDDDEDSENPKCAVCFKKNKTLVVLPCCGSNEVMSSTRFCEACMVKCLQSQQREDYYRDPYRMCLQSGMLVGECPRCRQLISICAYTDQRLVEILKATFQQSIWFADRNDSRTRFTLMAAAFMNPNFLPIESLGENADRLRRLCEWKILHKTDSKDMYTIDPFQQDELKEYVIMILHMEDTDHEIGPEGDDKYRYQKQALTYVSSILLIASRKVFVKFRPITSLRLLHRGIYFGYQAKGFFPMNYTPLEWWQELIVAILNTFLIITIPTICFSSFCAIQLVSCILMIKPQRIKSGCMIALAIASYRHKEFLSHMGYLLLATCTSSKPVLIEPSTV